MRDAYVFTRSDRIASSNFLSGVIPMHPSQYPPFLVTSEPFAGESVSSFTVKFSDANAYCQVGVVDADEHARNFVEKYMVNWAMFPLLHRTITYPSDGWNRVTIDMARREFSVTRLCSGEVVVHSDLPDRVWFVAPLKAEPGYEMSVRLA